jgi:hypothetical protein
VRLLALLLLLGCGNPVAPEACDDAFFRASAVADESLASFLAQLPNGHVVLNAPLVFDSVELADYVTATNRIEIRCAGGWQGQIVGKLTLRKTERDWELVMHGCALHGGSFVADYLQESHFYGTIIHRQNIHVKHSTNIAFHDARITESNIVLDEAGQTRFDGGLLGYSQLSITGTEGANGWGGPVSLQHMHVEFSGISVSAQSFSLSDSFLIASTLDTNVRQLYLERNDWLRSDLNGKPACG